MASLIDAVRRQALLTFSSKLSSLSFDENLNKLKHLVNKLTCGEVKLDKSLLLSEVRSECSGIGDNIHQNRLAPVTYIEIFENTDVTIGIFVLKSGARLPLHDHPMMYGILKVIYGSVHIVSYSPVSRKVIVENSNRATDVKDGLVLNDGDNILNDVPHPYDIGLSPNSLYRPISLFAVKEPEIMVGEKDEACVLCPRRGNLHEIYSVNGPAAFVDILSPPYETDIPGVGPRPCRYFKDVSSLDDSNSPLRKLIRIPSPPDYWSDTAPYEGPSCETD